MSQNLCHIRNKTKNTTVATTASEGRCIWYIDYIFYDKCCLCNVFYVFSLLTFYFIVFFLFRYVLWEYLLSQKQWHNTESATSADGRCVLFIESNFTMSVASVIFFSFLSAYLLFYLCIVLIWICAMRISTKAETTPQQRISQTK